MNGNIERISPVIYLEYFRFSRIGSNLQTKMYSSLRLLDETSFIQSVFSLLIVIVIGMQAIYPVLSEKC